MIARGWLKILIIAPLILSACDNDKTSNRGHIQRGTRGGKQPSTVEALKANDNKSCELVGKECMNLVRLSQCIKSQDNQDARLVTLSMALIEADNDLNRTNLISDSKMLAQLINAGNEQTKVNYFVKRMSELRPKTGVLDAVNQIDCKSVSLRDAKGDLREYQIVSKSKSTTMTLKSLNGEHGLTIRFQPGTLFVRAVERLPRFNYCGIAQNLSLETETELNYGAAINNPLAINQNLLQIAADHTDASDTLKQTLASPKAESSAAATTNQNQRARAGYTRLQVQEAVYAGLQSRLQAGQLKNLECGSKKPESGETAKDAKK